MPDNETEVFAQPEPQPVPVPPLTPPPPKRGAPVAALALIAVAVLGLGAVGYLAWQRGLLDGLVAPGTSPSPVKVAVVKDESAADDPNRDPLERLSDNVAGLKPYRKYVDVLRTIDAELEATRFEAGPEGGLSAASRQRLDELQILGTQFSKDYEDFERRAARDTQPKLQSYQDTVRKGFLERMRNFVGKVGQAYVVDSESGHPSFMLSDTFIAAVQAAGKADSTPLRDEWLSAVHAQEQDVLSGKFASELAEVQKRIEKLKQTHREVDELLKSAPEYRIRGGIIGSTARNLLDIYDSLAARVEADVIDFEQYVAKLPADHGSEELEAKLNEFNTLARQDHFHAFRETYKIYEQDKNLEHPAYARLKEHYNFVVEHWPSLKTQYQAQYTESETRWAKSWGDS